MANAEIHLIETVAINRVVAKASRIRTEKFIGPEKRYIIPLTASAERFHTIGNGGRLQGTGSIPS